MQRIQKGHATTSSIAGTKDIVLKVEPEGTAGGETGTNAKLLVSRRCLCKKNFFFNDFAGRVFHSQKQGLLFFNKY